MHFFHTPTAKKGVLTQNKIDRSFLRRFFGVTILARKLYFLI